MEKRNIISLAGDLASGKGTVSKILMKNLNYDVYRNGDYVRKLAKELNLDISSYNKYLADHPEIDLKIEKSAAEFAKEHDKFIIDARLGWYAVPDSFKVYLRVDINVAAKRAFEDQERKDTENFETLEEQKQDMINRYNLENERYWKLYNVRKDDMSNYDLVLDTTHISSEEAAGIIEKEFEKWLMS